MLTILIVSLFGLNYNGFETSSQVVSYNAIETAEPASVTLASGLPVYSDSPLCTSGNCPAATKTTVRTATTSCESGACGSYNERPRRRGLFGGLFKRGGRCRSGSCQ